MIDVPGSRLRQSESASDLLPRPNALIVGPMKAGTSWLYEYLKSRDDVVMPSGVKETFFFDERFESKGVDWYLAHFEHAANTNAAKIVEVAPTYFHPTPVPSRVIETLGPVKVVVTLRDPANRAFSLFNHMRRYGFTSCTTFRDAVQKHTRILDSSRYNECMLRWESVFGVENVSTLYMDDLKTNPLRFAANCCRALGLDPPTDEADFPTKVNMASDPRNYYVASLGRISGNILRSFRLYPVINAAKRIGLKKLFFGKPQTVRRTMTLEERAWFLGLVGDDIQALQDRIDRDISSWLSVGVDGNGGN